MSRINATNYNTAKGPSDFTGWTMINYPDYRKVISSTVVGSTSSSISNTKLYSIKIPANTFTTNEVLDLRTVVTKTGTNGTCTVRMYLNTTDAVGGVTIGLCTFASTSVFLPFTRRVAIRNTTTATLNFRNTVSAPNDIWFNVADYNGHATGGIDSQVVNWTSDLYLVIGGQLSSASDIMQCRFLKINN
jgi:hypothetical protein